MSEPAFVAETLTWCNSIRARRDLEPLAQLPKGKPDDPESCPCGKATGLYVDHLTYGEDADNRHTHNLPEAVVAFVGAFDAGRLPQYEEPPEPWDDEEGPWDGSHGDGE